MPLISLKLDEKTYTIDSEPFTFTAAELNAVERETGMLVGEWSEKLKDRRGSTLAWTALAWTAKRRAGEFVKWHVFEADLSILEVLGTVDKAPVEPAAEPAASKPSRAKPKPPATS